MWSRLPGPAGTLAPHGALVALIFHFHVLREVVGQRPAAEMEWTWRPEVTRVTLVEPPPEPPPPKPLPEPVAEESPVALPEESKPEPEVRVEPEPVPPPPVAETAPSRLHDAWADVRAGIIGALRHPARARQGWIEGVVVAVLSLDETGAIASAKIRSPEPSPLICAAVLQAVRRAGPFPGAGKAIRAGEMPATAEMAIRFELRRADF